MNKKFISIFFGAIIISLMFFLLLKYVQDNAKQDIDKINLQQENNFDQENQKLIVGTKFPNISLYDLNGNKVSLEDYEGKIVFLNFWTTWCIYCDKEMPDLQELYDNNRDDLVVLTINVGESKQVVQEYMKNNKYTFPVLLDEDESLPSKFEIGGFPTTFFIDKQGNLVGFTNPDGNLIDRIPGMMTKEQMTWFLKEIKNMEKLNI